MSPVKRNWLFAYDYLLDTFGLLALLSISCYFLKFCLSVFSSTLRKHTHATAIFHGCKNDNIQLNFFDYFHIFAQNIYCG